MRIPSKLLVFVLRPLGQRWISFLAFKSFWEVWFEGGLNWLRNSVLKDRQWRCSGAEPERLSGFRRA